ncbi:RNA 2'-O ribose methyltransferase substrate binding family protein [Lyngbya aestuarii BL J]|uniref:RNA 2'-O ribose methyltransferase substrate binding family protein n=1 Tax=Lyngbya aestuarii BL J TaxID=1348334 RepID=U7QBB6_9CYAN|nr:RNA methyltransferase [Lyngbya aestuarii]ERT04021.1 RNA 2'-O ribose methyltransferase substrate binding family protein [Lyngbya aestuarii BL J]
MLTSVQNPLIKQLRKLQRTKGRREQQLFLLEGTHLIEEALATQYPLLTVCYTPQWQNRYPALWEGVCQAASRSEEVNERVLQAIATTVNPDGIIATAPRPQPQTVAISQIGLALETVQDPGNLGTMIRTAAAAGVDGLWLSNDSVDLDHPKVLRASAGAWFRLPMAVCGDLTEQLTLAQQQGVQIVATLPDADLTYWELDFQQPTIVLLGNEGAGLSSSLTALANQHVQIPLSGGVESLNVAICAALMLYEAQRQHQNQTLNLPSNLPSS